MIIISPFIVRLITGKFAAAITLWPFIVLRDPKLKENETIIRHEKIHLRQQAELAILLFYILYAVEFTYHFLKTFNRRKAYYRISFEREAYANENNVSYLNNRKFLAFRRYFF